MSLLELFKRISGVIGHKPRAVENDGASVIFDALLDLCRSSDRFPKFLLIPHGDWTGPAVLLCIASALRRQPKASRRLQQQESRLRSRGESESCEWHGTVVIDEIPTDYRKWARILVVC